MKVLVLSVTAGGGHNTCAKAAIAALEARGAECRMLDTLGFLSSLLGAGVDKGYLLMGKLTPAAFGMLYEASLAGSEKHGAAGFPLESLIPAPAAEKMEKVIDDFAPDCIICTHVFAALIITRLRKSGGCRMLTIGINTDFSIHPMWEQVEQDHFVLPCAAMHYEAAQRGLPTEKILPFGIPVAPRFAKRVEQTAARAALGLPERPTVTVMSGSMGFGHLAAHLQSLDALEPAFQMVAICGNNREAEEEIGGMIAAGYFTHQVFCHGFVDNVHQFMQAGDILVTKPGGLSTTECLHVGRPMVLVEPIPGLEQHNAAFLVNCGAVVYVNEFYPLEAAVYNLLASEERRANMMQAQKLIHPGVAGELLADFVYGHA